MRRDEITDLVLDNVLVPALTRIADFTYDDEDGLLETITRTQSVPEHESQLTTIARYDDVYRNVQTTTTVGTWQSAGGGLESGTRATTVEYDEHGVHVARVFRHNGTDECSSAKIATAECQTTEVRYDPRDGTLIARLDANGIGERWAFDAFGRNVKHETATDTISKVYSGQVADDESGVIPVRPRMRIDATSLRTSAASTTFVDALDRVVRTVGTGIGGQLVYTETDYHFGNLVWRTSRPHAAADASQGVVVHDFDARLRPKTKVFPMPDRLSTDCSERERYALARA